MADVVFGLLFLVVPGSRAAVSVENAVGLVVAVCLVVHLVLCLLFADRLSVVELNRELR